MLNHDAGNLPRTTALLTAVGWTPTASPICLRPMASANCSVVSILAPYPQMVDGCKSTIGSLLARSQMVDAYTMKNDPGKAVTKPGTPPPYAEIGKRLERLRTTQSDLTQKAWAGKHGFNGTQYNNWENGTRRIPVDRAEHLCDIYGLTLDFIYRGRRDQLSESMRKVL